MTSNADDRSAAREAWALEQLGRTLGGRYRLEELRGIGGMGAVYVARHVHVDTLVALKLVLPHRVDAADRDQLKREARRAASVGGRGVVSVTDFDFDASGDAFLVMELLRGQTLGERIERRGALSPEAVLPIAREVLDVLSRLHARGLVHGDLKPSNLFLCDDGDGEPVKVLDFGIASVLDQEAPDAASGVRGTPAFMAPEQLEGGIDARVDLYGLGAVLYHALSGRRPYQGLSGADVLSELRAGPPHALSTLAPHLPPTLIRLVEQAMARDSDQRFADAAAFSAAIDTLPSHAAAARDEGEHEVDTLTSPVPLESGPTSSAVSATEAKGKAAAGEPVDVHDVEEAGARRAATTGASKPGLSGRRGLALGITLAAATAVGLFAWPRDEAPIERPADAVETGVEHVLAPFGDRYLFPAVVVERTGDEARVVFADGDVASVPAEGLRPDAVVPGVCPLIRAHRGPGARACVLRRYGDAILVRPTEGSLRWTSMARVAVPPTALRGVDAYEPEPPPSEGEPGTVVLANFQGRGPYYPGTIAQRDVHNRSLVVYADGDSEWLEASQLRMADIEEGMAVRAAPRPSALPDPDIGDALVMVRRGLALRLRFADSREAWVSLSNVQVPPRELE